MFQKLIFQKIKIKINDNFSETTMKDLEPPKKRSRVCLKCRKPSNNKNKCEHCGVKFRDGFLIRFFKKLLGFSSLKN